MIPTQAADQAPTPTELFVAPLAACVAFYVGRYLTATATSATGFGYVRSSTWHATTRPG